MPPWITPSRFCGQMGAVPLSTLQENIYIWVSPGLISSGNGPACSAFMLAATAELLVFMGPLDSWQENQETAPSPMWLCSAWKLQDVWLWAEKFLRDYMQHFEKTLGRKLAAVEAMEICTIHRIFIFWDLETLEIACTEFFHNFLFFHFCYC